MSLINQMLKDLEQRHAAADRTAPLAGEVRAVAMGRQSSVFPMWGIGLAVVLLLVGAAAWWWSERAVQAPQLQTIQPQSIQGQVAAPAAAVTAPATEPGGYVPPPTVAEAPVVPVATDAAPMGEKRHVGLDRSMTSVQEQRDAPAARRAPESQPPAMLPPDAEATSKSRQNAGSAGGVSRPLKTVSASQQAENTYRQAVSVLQQGRVAEAQDLLRKVLDTNPRHGDARQMLVGLMVDARHHPEAMALLQEGLRLAPEQSGFRMTLARLQVESGDLDAGVATLEQGLKSGSVDPEYQGFYAALLQRQGRHDEAVQYYLAALNADPAMPTWLVGIGISLEQVGKRQDALAAFQRARDTGQLTPQLTGFVDQRLAELKRP